MIVLVLTHHILEGGDDLRGERSRVALAEFALVGDLRIEVAGCEHPDECVYP